jgi:hypothetical protein
MHAVGVTDLVIDHELDMESKYLGMILVYKKGILF